MSRTFTEYLPSSRDTVNAVGLIPHRLPFTSSNSSIKTFRHAVSLDEHRAKFKANLYNLPTKKDTELGTKPGEMPKSTVTTTTTTTTVQGVNGELSKEADGGNNDRVMKRKGKGRRDAFRRFEEEFDATEKVSHDTDVLEVWFAGCHCGTCMPRSVYFHSLTSERQMWVAAPSITLADTI